MVKQLIIGSIFTGNLIYSGKKVRTKKVKEVVSLPLNTSKAFEKKNKGQPNIKLKSSPMVNPRGTNSNHFMADLQKINGLRGIL
jgi:hypothetical protein